MPEWVTWSCAANVLQFIVIIALAGWLRSEHDRRVQADRDLKTPVGRMVKKAREG